MASESNTVYLIRPRPGGFANDTVIQVEKGELLYHVKSRLLSPVGREYSVYDSAMKEVLLRTEPDHTTTILPHHTIFQKDHPVGKLGQAGIMPQSYFVELPGVPRAEVHLGSADPIFPLRNADGVVAEIAENHATWIVVIPTLEKERLLILSAIAIIYRESTIAGC
jgi:hypothetical protein